MPSPNNFMRTLRGSIVIALAAVVAFGALPVSAQAPGPDEVTVKVRVESTEAPKIAIGILVAKGKTKQYSNPYAKRESNTVIELSFNAKREDIVDGTLATAMMITEKGKKIFANMVPLSTGEGKDPLSGIEECPAQDASKITVQSQLGLLTQLYEVRKQRRDFSMQKMSEIMQGDLLAKLQQFESVLGLSRGVELTPELPPLELIDRLSRILNSLAITKLRREEIRKASMPTPTPLPRLHLDE